MDNESPLGGVTPVLSELDLAVWFNRVADSKAFQTAPMLRTLLLYLWEHRGQNTSEYAIAVEALGRRPDFNAKTDSTVRVQIARLRTKLKEFYAAEDRFPLVLSVPLGGHALQCDIRADIPASLSVLAPVPQRRRALILALSAAVAVLAVTCGFLLVQNRKLQQSSHLRSPAPLPRFWRNFLAGGLPTSIVVPNPPHFYWRAQEVYVRDQKISEFSKWPNSPLLHDLAAKWGLPAVNENWMTAMEVMASVQVLQYLEKKDLPVQLIRASSIPLDLTHHQNVIYLSNPRATGYVSEVMAKTNFHITKTYPISIGNRKPRPGEPGEYEELVQSDQRRTVPGLIMLLPGSAQGTRSLVMVGRFSNGLVSMLLSEEGLGLVDREWRESGSPDAWEMVAEIEVRGDTVLKVRPKVMRKITSTDLESPVRGSESAQR